MEIYRTVINKKRQEGRPSGRTADVFPNFLKFNELHMQLRIPGLTE